MIKQASKIIIGATILTAVTATCFAAAPGGPKPTNCPMGQIAVKKGDMWVCQIPSIQAQSSMGAGMSSQNVGTGSPIPTPMPKRAPPAPVLPDLVIHSVEKTNPMNDPKRMTVHVQNIGAAPSKGGQVRIDFSGGQFGIGNIPDIAPGQIRLVYVNFDKNVESGQTKTMADSSQNVNESNENNNIMQKYFR